MSDQRETEEQMLDFSDVSSSEQKSCKTSQSRPSIRPELSRSNTSDQMLSLIHSTRVGTVIETPLYSMGIVKGKQARLLCHPKHNVYFAWKWILVTTMLYDMFFAPLQVGWNVCDPGYFCVWPLLDSIADTIFLIDIVICFRTGLIVKFRGREKIIWDAGTITISYLKSDFLLDLISVGIPYFSPILTLYQELSSDSTSQPPRELELLSLFRVLRIFKVFRMVTKLTNISVGKVKYLTLGKLLFGLLYSGHLVGCLMFYVGSDEYAHVKPGSWADAAGLADATGVTQYLAGVYFAMATVTTVGYGDITAQPGAEQLFMCFIMLLSALYYVNIIGSFTHIVDSLSKTQRALMIRTSQVHAFCTSYRIDPRITQHVIKTLKYKWSFTQSLDSLEDALSVLPKTLKFKVLSTVYMPTLYKVSLFSGCDETVIRTLSSLFREEVYLPHTQVLTLGDLNNSLYVKEAGELEIIDHLCRAKLVKNGGTFGELHAFVPNVTVVNTVRTKKKCELLAITGKDLLGVLNHFPETLREMETQILADVEKTLKDYDHYIDNIIFFAGQMICVIHRATNLRKKDSSTSTDPYVDLKLVGVRSRTHVLLQTCNPVWSEDFRYNIEGIRYVHFDMLDEMDEDFEELVGGTIGHRATNAAKYKSQLDAEMLGIHDASLSLFAVEEEEEKELQRFRSTGLFRRFKTEKEKLDHRKKLKEKARQLREEPVKDIFLKLRVMDRDIVSKDELLGSCEIKLDDMLNKNTPTESSKKWYTLLDEDESPTAAKIEVEFIVRHKKFAISQQVAQLRLVKNELQNKLRFFSAEQQHDVHNNIKALWVKMNREKEALRVQIADLQERCRQLSQTSAGVGKVIKEATAATESEVSS